MKPETNHDAARSLRRISRCKLRLAATFVTVLAVFSSFRFAVGQGVGEPAPPAAADGAEPAGTAAPTADPAQEVGGSVLESLTAGEPAAGPEPEPEAPAAEGIVERLKGFAGSCGLDLILSPGLSKSERKSLPYEFSPGDNFVESFAAANGLVWFANGRSLYVSEREDHRSALVPVDRTFGERVVQRLVEQRQLQDLGAGKYGLGCNRIQFMETPHAFVTGHIEFLRFIKEKFGIQTGAVAKTESADVDVQVPGSQEEAGAVDGGAGVLPESGGLSVLGNDRGPTRPVGDFTGQGGSYAESAMVEEAGQESTITSKGAMEVRSFRFEHAWVATVTLDGQDSNKIVAPGIFNLFTKLCGRVRNEDFSSANITTTTAESAQISNALLAAESANIGDFDNLYDLRSKRLATESLLGVSPFAGASAESGLLGGEEAAAELRAVADNILFPGEGVSAPPPVERVLPAGVQPINVRAAIPQQLGASPGEDRGTSGVSYSIGAESGVLDQGVAPADLPTLHAGIIADPTTNTIIVCDEGRFMDAYAEIHRQLDRPQFLVEISAVIIDINVDSRFTFSSDFGGFGVEELGSETKLFGRGRFDGGLLRRGKSIETSPFPGGAIPLFDPNLILGGSPLSVAAQVIGSSGQFNARIQVLQGDGKAKILARPTLLTIDGAKAVFSDNDSVYVEAPGEHNADLYRVNAPLSLEVTPRTIGEGGEELKLVIKITDSAGKPEDSTEVPVVGESLIDTSAIVGQGQSLLIGGRYRTEQVENDQGIPLLGRIPVLGLAFKDKEVRNARLQRLFLITPRVIDPMTLRPIPDAPPITAAQPGRPGK